MSIEMPPELLEAMQDLDGKHWDDIIELWRKREADNKQYEELYLKQIDGQNLGNRTFQERKRLLTPAEKREEALQGILQTVQIRKEADFEKQLPQELTTEERQEKFAELKSSLFKYTKREQRSDPPHGKEDVEPDKGGDLDKDE
ncbi:hypothetical protein GO495_17640 [Chitinophaga oryziterrae]|uniref:Uncharacterized protein n=1 Tax=Chitinophaga oryziterrae TaxID=1031224 RepID=A0A6N8JB21_9BACT|nr:hypothetical protein [Chitinophaga oryziterrae]MVT42420.1 hypothetical protein [Chitinophaga oryziterrae]